MGINVYAPDYPRSASFSRSGSLPCLKILSMFLLIMSYSPDLFFQLAIISVQDFPLLLELFILHYLTPCVLSQFGKRRNEPESTTSISWDIPTLT